MLLRSEAIQHNYILNACSKAPFNMPKPKTSETKTSYMRRCIPYVRKENPGKKRMFYVLKCQALWDKYRGN